jgi:peptidoglycan/LPS O-acetylase OafA/YrhL
MRLTPVLDHRANNFDFLRFAAASLVLYSHCFALTGAGGREPLVQLTFGDYSLGGLAVRVFFVISGFLVMQSWLRRPHLTAFSGARFLRIFPALVVALVYCIVVGSIVTTLPAREYFAHPQTLEFFWHNLRMRTEYFLPAVFEHNVEARAVNGSLWSLPFEVRAYVVVLVLGAIGLLRRPALGLFAWLGAASLIVLWPAAWGNGDHDRQVMNLCACFVAAALVAILPRLDRVLLPIAAASLASLPFVIHKGLFADVAMNAFLVSGTLGFARLKVPGLASFGRFGDFSYGMFLYAFPTQQVIAWLTDTRAPYAMLALAFPATLVLAVTSWYVIERPFLRLKRRLDPRPDPATRQAAV